MTDTPSSDRLFSDRRPSQFLHPTSGRTVCVAPNPEAVETLRRQLSQTHGEDKFDIYIKGSEEHLKAIEESRAHHEERREALRNTHAEAFSEFERVRAELDALSAELQSLTTQGVSLDANFNRFGYSAHIRTIEDDSASTAGLSRAASRSEAGGERPMGEARRLWKRPAIRQYYHKGLIWRASTDTEVGAIELFVDLLYVGIIATIGDRAAEEPTGFALLRYCITFILSFRMWSDLTQTLAWIDEDDIFARGCVLLFVACLVGFATNIANAFESTYTELVAFFLAERLFNALYFFWLAWLIPMVRFVMIGFGVLIVLSSALWIGSIHVEYPNQLALIWLAIAWDLFAGAVIIAFVRGGDRLQGTWLESVAKRMQFYPALNIEHRTERMNAFVTLVIGYSVVALFYQSSAPAGINAFFGKAILGLIIAYSFCLIYFEIDSTNLYVHAIRRHALAYWLWQYAHLPFILAFVLGAGALSKLVVAHDCPDTDVAALAEASAAKSVGELDPGLRWFFCGGVGVALACTALISLSHDHKDLPGLRVRKRYRLALRFVLAGIVVVLPTAEDRLNSLTLIAVVAGLVLVSLGVELWGCSDHEQGSFWADRSACKYAADCKLRKKDLEALNKGEVSRIEDLMRREKRDPKMKGDGIDVA